MSRWKTSLIGRAILPRIFRLHIALPMTKHQIALLYPMGRPKWMCQMVEGKMPRLKEISLATPQVEMQVAPPTLAARQISYQAPQQLIQKMQQQLQVQIQARRGRIPPELNRHD